MATGWNSFTFWAVAALSVGAKSVFLLLFSFRFQGQRWVEVIPSSSSQVKDADIKRGGRLVVWRFIFFFFFFFFSLFLFGLGKSY